MKKKSSSDNDDEMRGNRLDFLPDDVILHKYQK